MIVDPLSAAIARPQVQSVTLEKVAIPEQPRPVQGASESLDTGLDVNKEKNAKNRQISEQNKDSEIHPLTYNARGNPKRHKPSDSKSEEDGESVDLFV